MIKITLGALALSLLALPGISHAAMYAYVNTSGEVMSMEATNASAAIQTAPGIHINSGVLLLDGSADMEIVGDDVPGA